MIRIGILAAGAALLASCVPYPGAPVEEPATTIEHGPFLPLDAGAAEVESLHFKVRAYGSDNAKRVSEAVEADYNRIMLDTNLYSFRPAGLYEIVVYASQDEYRRKTQQPEWSGGATVGNSIFTFLSPNLGPTMAHEMTHLIFYEFMARVNTDHRWVNEGLAVYEEMTAGGPQYAQNYGASLAAARQQPLTMDQMIHLVPATERERTVSTWYAQSESMVRFMIERGGRIGFSQFLGALKDGRGFDEAVAIGYPTWRNLSDFQAQWQRAQQ